MAAIAHGHLRGRVRLVASAVAGNPVELRLGRGWLFHAEGRSIHIGEAAAGWSDDEVLKATMAQSALIALGSLEPDALRLLRGASPEVRAHYVALELRRAADQLRDVLPARLQRAIRRELEAARPSGPAESTSARESAQLAAAIGRKPITLPDWCGDLVVRTTRGARSTGSDAPSQAELRAAMNQGSEPGEEGDEQADRATFLERLAGPFSGPVGRAFQRMMGAERGVGGGVAGVGVAGGVSSRLGAVPDGAVAVSLAPSAATTRPGASIGVRHPEWDEVRRRYRPDWCTAVVLEPVPALRSVPSRQARVERVVARQLSRLSQAVAARGRAVDGHELDITSVVEMRMAVASWQAPDPRVYLGQRRRTRDLAVLVVLDATDSSNDRRGPAARGIDGQRPSSLFAEQRALADVLAGALQDLDIHAATYAFRSRGRDDVRFLRCGGFTDRWDAPARRRLWSIRPSGFTRLGAVVRHGAHLLQSQDGIPLKMLILITDGIAYDDGYEGGYARADTARAIAEARDAGVGCVALSARDSAGLSDLWGLDGYRVVRDPAAAAGEIRTLVAGELGRVVNKGGRRAARRHEVLNGSEQVR